jgi:hypothetical protein
MRGATTILSGLGAALAGGLACGETQIVPPPAPPKVIASPKTVARVDPPRPYRPGEMPVTLGDEPDEVVDVSLERGFLNQSQVNDVLAGHTERLGSCYARAGDAQLFAHGEVRLRFHVAASGDVDDVLVIDNELGNYAVERCLVVEGRKIRFPRPGGNKHSDFEYTMEFRSPRQKYVVIWRRGTLHRPIAARMRTLGRCGSPGDHPVQAVAYIKPSGSVASVGLASEGKLEVQAATCVVGQILKWRLRGDRGHVVRTSFPVSKGIAAPSADASTAAPLGPTARLKRAGLRRVRHD